MSESNVIPTKANLMKMKQSLAFAKKSYELLDRKRTVLVREMMDLNEKAKSLQSSIENEFVRSFQTLEEAALTMGMESMEEIINSMEKEAPYDIKFRTVMGVEIPEVRYEGRPKKTQYGFYRTTTAFDMANMDMKNVGTLIYQLAEMETSVFRLADEIKKTQKLANALEKIQIPKYEAAVNRITDVLEEKEREEFFRLKKLKKRKER